MDDETRFRELFARAYPALRRYAHHRGLSAADSDDLVAGTLEVAWRRFSDVPTDEPMPWLYTVAHNLWRNQHRTEGRRASILARFGAPPAVSGDHPGDPGDRGDPGGLDEGALRAAFADLGADDQELLRLIAWDGLTPAQAATVLGCTPVAARSRLHRARNRLASRIGIDPRAAAVQQAAVQQAADAQRAAVQQSGAKRQIPGEGFTLQEVLNDPAR
ncbi:RNA polymerase sigma factor [Streptacidiphilus sp. PAMC 29251]